MNKLVALLIVCLMAIGGSLIFSGSTNLNVINDEQMRGISGGADIDCKGTFNGCSGMCGASCVSQGENCDTYGYETNAKTCIKCSRGILGTCTSGSEVKYCCKRYTCEYNSTASECMTSGQPTNYIRLVCGDSCEL